VTMASQTGFGLNANHANLDMISVRDSTFSESLSRLSRLPFVTGHRELPVS
jgi:hypothetical protein